MAILDAYGRPIVMARQQNSRFRELLARYDAAQTTEDNYRHWAMADGLSPNSANVAEVRRKLRNRARYEVANNSYARGMVDTLANDVIGTGPRVEIRTGNKKADTWIEREYAEWCRATRLAKVLRTARKAKATDGELFLMLTTAKLGTPVQLYVRDFECDMVDAPGYHQQPTAREAEGVRYDAVGRPTAYYIYKDHPGDVWSSMLPEGKWHDAGAIVHMFRQDRAGQRRGIPEMTPALPLFSQLRRYTLAVLAAAETAADFAMTLETQLPPGQGTPAGSGGWEHGDTFMLAQRMVTVLPEGTKLNQTDAKQPTTTYGEFKHEILGEAFAALLMPYNVGAHDSSKFNFASGKLDRLGYGRAVEIEQSDWHIECSRRVFLAWLEEAFLVPNYMPDGLPPIAQWETTTQWDGLDDIDPVKAATANEILLRSGQISLPTLHNRAGRPWEVEQQRAAESLGIPVAEYQARLADSLFGPPKASTAGTDESAGARDEGTAHAA